MTIDVALRSLPCPAWRLAASLPDGPVELWLVALRDDGALAGGSKIPWPLSWAWRGGMLCWGCEVRMIALASGTVARLVIVVVTPDARYAPVIDMDMPDGPFRVFTGSVIHVHDGMLKLKPEAR
jgi:hypothetical protein